LPLPSAFYGPLCPPHGRFGQVFQRFVEAFLRIIRPGLFGRRNFSTWDFCFAMANTGVLHQVSKIDAAHSQLRTAIKMWFYDEDYISAHTLAYAAYEIVQALSKAKNPKRPDLLLDSSQIKPDKRKEFNQLFREAANFFKHADRDPHATIEFSPGLTELFIYFAIKGIELCGVPPARELVIFISWLQIRTPALMSDKAREVITNSPLINNLTQAQAMHQHEFFEACMYGLSKSDAA
jgi:hypothetical protein